jgi:hypothetical protein
MTDTQRFYGVTSITKLGMGTGRALVEWNARTPAETAFDRFGTLSAYVNDDDRQGAVKWLMDSRHQQSGAAKARGSELHAAAEKLALGVSPEVDHAIVPYVEQYKLFLETFEPEFLMAEAPVYNTRYSYAGTTDGIFIIDGKRLLFDIKTVKVLPGELNESGKPKHRGPYEEVALQLAAYRNAEMVGLMAERVENYYGRYYVYDPSKHFEPMPEVDGTVALMVSPADYRVIPVRSDQEIFEIFLNARECARFNVDLSKRVFGPEITHRSGEGVEQPANASESVGDTHAAGPSPEHVPGQLDLNTELDDDIPLGEIA